VVEVKLVIFSAVVSSGLDLVVCRKEVLGFLKKGFQPLARSVIPLSAKYCVDIMCRLGSQSSLFLLCGVVG
jgi:hypothetical protein